MFKTFQFSSPFITHETKALSSALYNFSVYFDVCHIKKSAKIK